MESILFTFYFILNIWVSTNGEGERGVGGEGERKHGEIFIYSCGSKAQVLLRAHGVLTRKLIALAIIFGTKCDREFLLARLLYMGV